MGICIVLDRRGLESRVLLNSQDISHMVAAVHIEAYAGKPPLVTLALLGPVELMGDVNVELKKQTP